MLPEDQEDDGDYDAHIEDAVLAFAEPLSIRQ